MRRRAVVIGLGALVCSLAGLTWLAVSAPTAVESLAVDLYQRSQAQTAAQAAERIASRLRAVERRLTDPLIRQASGIVNGHDEPSYGAALGAMARPSDPDQGVVLLVHDRQGKVLGVDPRMADGMQSKFLAHKHHDHDHGWHDGAGVCATCLSKLKALSLATSLGQGRFLSANVDVRKLARSALSGLVGVEGASAALIGPAGGVLFTVSTDGITPGPDAVTGRSSVDVPGVPWAIEVRVPRSEIAPKVAAATRKALLVAIAIALLLLLGAGVLAASERLRAAEEARREAMLAHQDKLATIGTLTASVNHEIRNALMAARSYVELASEEADGQQREDLDAATVALARLGEVAHGLSRFGRQDGDDAQPIEVSSLVDDALAVTRPRLKHGPPIDLQVADDAVVNVAAGPLVQVLVNLLLNAAQAMGKGAQGEISLLIDVVDDRARLAVQDCGPGLPKGSEKHLFDAFFTTKPAGEGTGLGLWISRKIVEQNGGRLSARNVSQGTGARFEITLPRFDVSSEARGLPG